MPLKSMFDSEHNECWFWFGFFQKISKWKDLEPGIIIINVHFSLIALANTLPIRAKREKTYGFR